MTIDWEKFGSLFLYDKADPLLFNSTFFLFFFALFLLFYQFFYKKKLTRVLIFTLFSLYFFYKACGIYVGFIVLAAVVDFNLSNWIWKARDKGKRRALLIVSVVINLGLLAFFKYTDLFIQTVNDLGAGKIDLLHLTIPIGISFYTFENLSYTIDVYRRHFKPVNNFWDYLFFLSFFPKLVMGPIVRAADFVPQIRQTIQINREHINRGLFLILGGLFKKVVISDYIYANFVDYIFDDPSRYSGLECLFGVYGYAMVIYCDFSGYSDMAIGMASWMGFRINTNFMTPYQSASITEFWRRWHISLSSWLKDYLYIPLGGNRKGKFRTYLNLMLTMLLGGLWHGASWNFVVWGGLHGLGLTIDKLRMEYFPRAVSKPGSPMKWLGTLWTFHLVCLCWIFFKAESFEDSTTILTQITQNFNAAGFAMMWENYHNVFLIMGLGYLIHFLPQRLDEWLISRFDRITLAGRIALVCIFIWLVVQSKQAEPVMPIYLQF
ncbi:MAG: MBOAT family protein [Bacteroidia bacterium]|nr:MBOAT family protein [Bacteroidia bacterium]